MLQQMLVACMRCETTLDEVIRIADQVQKDQIKIIAKNIELEIRIKALENRLG